MFRYTEMRVFPRADVLAAHAANRGGDFREILGPQKLAGLDDDVLVSLLDVKQAFKLLWKRHSDVFHGFLPLVSFMTRGRLRLLRWVRDL